jgi:hypothetical protein
MKRLTTILFFAITSLALLSLKSDAKYILRIDIKVMDEETEKGLAGAKVEVYSEEKLVHEATTDLNGVVPKFEIPLYTVYKVYIKKENYVTKLVQIDATTDHVKKVLMLNVLRMEPTLFKKEPGVDLSFLDTMALVKYKFDRDGIMEFDQKYTAGVLEKVNAVREKK